MVAWQWQRVGVVAATIMTRRGLKEKMGEELKGRIKIKKGEFSNFNMLKWGPCEHLKHVKDQLSFTYFHLPYPKFEKLKTTKRLPIMYQVQNRAHNVALRVYFIYLNFSFFKINLMHSPESFYLQTDLLFAFSLTFFISFW